MLSRRFRDANRMRVQFAAQDTIGRIATRLLELSERYGDPTDAGIEIRLPVTQADLGGWTASSRAAVTGALRTPLRFSFRREAIRKLRPLAALGTGERDSIRNVPNAKRPRAVDDCSRLPW